MDRVVRRPLLFVVACCAISVSAGCSVDVTISPDAGIDASVADSIAVDATVESGPSDTPEDLAQDVTWIDADPSCSAYCACMTTTCASEPSYPFPDLAACQSWCSKRSDPERTCFAQFCAAAAITKGPAIKTHDCEHAIGLWGTTECM